MIKRFHQFNESVELNFYNSDKYKKCIEEYKMDQSILDDFIIDIKDEDNIDEYNIIQVVDEGGNKPSKLIINAFFTKYYDKVSNEDKKKEIGIELKDYYNLLKRQSDVIDLQKNDLKEILQCCERIGKTQDLKITRTTLLTIPDKKSNFKSTVLISFEKEVNTDKLKEIKKEFDHIKINRLDKITKYMIRLGVSKEDAKKLIDIDTDYDDPNELTCVFYTNEQIIIIGHIKSNGEIIQLEDNNIKDCIQYYNSGWCSDVLFDDLWRLD